MLFQPEWEKYIYGIYIYVYMVYHILYRISQFLATEFAFIVPESNTNRILYFTCENMGNVCTGKSLGGSLSAKSQLKSKYKMGSQV